MDEPKGMATPFRSLNWRRCLLAVCTAAMLLQVGCDSFFGMEGHLYQCGTKVPIAGADGIAGREGNVLAKFTTDRNGQFSFGLTDGPRATVTVSFVKEGFVPFSQRFEGEPANPHEMEFCMDPVAQP